MEDNDRSSERAKEIARRVRRGMLLSPGQRRQEHRAELARRIREQPEKMAEEGRKLGALRFFLRCYSDVEPKLLEELREMLSKDRAPWADELKDLSNRYYLPPTIDVANECMLTLLMWQALPDIPSNRWHFELPQGRLANPLHPGTPNRPYPFLFEEKGWNPEIETLKEARERLQRQFKLALEGHLQVWEKIEAAFYAYSELSLFEKSTSPAQLRHLRWLAEKQATPRLTNEQLAETHSCSSVAVSLGIEEAADLIGLPRKAIRKVPAGRHPKRPRRNR